jgi:lysine-ketoglutarate reductase/saccharopine dehydrogenase-like protein (TIGR00300 family)
MFVFTRPGRVQSKGRMGENLAARPPPRPAAEQSTTEEPDMASESITLEGHLIHGRVLANVLDEIAQVDGADYDIIDLHIGDHRDDVSFARIEVTASTEGDLARLLDRLQQHGANPDTVEDATLAEADVNGAFPSGFYSTTNLETEVRLGGRWIPVAHPEMDCGIVVDDSGPRTIPMEEVGRGMKIVMAGLGIRVAPVEPPRGERGRGFEFMSSDVSSEKPKALLVDRVAAHMREVKSSRARILWVAGPALVHTGAGPDLSALIRAGYVDALFAGNGLAAHDIESNMFGTSLGVHLEKGMPAEHGHEHHIRAINELRRHGSFRAAIDAGLFNDGIVYHLVRHGVDYLFGGSVRDDGPLPEVVSDMAQVQSRLRELIWGPSGDDLVGFCIVVGTMLHGIAAGNCLPASVPLACVDISQATVTKLMDRGSWQSIGIITDVGLFVRELAERLAAGEIRETEAERKAREAGARTRR